MRGALLKVLSDIVPPVGPPPAEVAGPVPVEADAVAGVLVRVARTDREVVVVGPGSQGEKERETTDIRREVVAQIFQAGTGKELWHTHWQRTILGAPVRLVTAQQAAKEASAALLEAIEEIWIAFWIG